MKYTLESKALHLIHVLRYLIRMGGSHIQRGVLECTWEFRWIFSNVQVRRLGPNGWETSEVFPETKDSVPFRVSGIRLVERVALVEEFEETELVRLSDTH